MCVYALFGWLCAHVRTTLFLVYEQTPYLWRCSGNRCLCNFDACVCCSFDEQTLYYCTVGCNLSRGAFNLVHVLDMREPNAEGVKSECLSDGDVHRQVFSVDKFSSTEDLSVTKANKASVSKGWPFRFLLFFWAGEGETRIHLRRVSFGQSILMNLRFS